MKKLLLFALLFVAVYAASRDVGDDYTPYTNSASEVVGWEESPWKDVTITTYNPTKAQCDDTPLITACGGRIDTIALRNKELKWCALSRDLLEVYSYGDTIDVYIRDGHEYNGRYVVMDTMNKRFTNYIDILTLHKGGKWKGMIK